MTEDASAVRLADVAAALRRGWRTLLLVTVLLTVLGGLAGVLIPRSYTATAVLTVSSIPANPLLSAQPKQQVDTTTERAVLQSTEVAARAKRILRSPATPEALAERVKVGSPSESEVLEVDATAGTPGAAARTANAFAHGYLDLRAAQARGSYAKISGNLDRRIAAVTGRIDRASSAADADAARQQLRSLQTQRSTIAGTVIEPGQVVTEAGAASARSSLPPAVYPVGGLVVGLLLGVAAALGRERFGKRVGSGARLATRTRLPVLEQGRTPDFLDRLAVRAGLLNPAPLVTVALLGTEADTAAGLGAALSARLQRTGLQPSLVHDSGEDAPLRPAGADRHAEVTLVTVSAADGLARAVLRAHNADHRVLVVTAKTPTATVQRLQGELEATGTGADVIAVVDDATAALPVPTGSARHAELVD